MRMSEYLQQKASFPESGEQAVYRKRDSNKSPTLTQSYGRNLLAANPLSSSGSGGMGT